jgi:L-fuculose-phosphate aldolase
MTQPDVEQLLARLSGAHAILSCNGHDDLTLGHMALRDPKGHGFWIKRADAGMRELTGLTDYQLLAFDRKLISGSGRQHSEWPIHAQLMQSRPNVNVSVHTHAERPTLLSVFDGGMRALTTDAGYLGKVTTLALEASHIDTPALAAELAKAFGQTHAILLKNHVVVFAGRTIEHATLIGFYLVRAARAELRARGVRDGTVAAELKSVASRVAMMSNDRWLVDSFACLAGRLSSNQRDRA